MLCYPNENVLDKKNSEVGLSCNISISFTHVWTQNTNSVKRLHLLQKKFFRRMFYEGQNSRADPLFKDSKILKSFDKVFLENSIFIIKSLKSLLP